VAWRGGLCAGLDFVVDRFSLRSWLLLCDSGRLGRGDGAEWMIKDILFPVVDYNVRVLLVKRALPSAARL